MSFDTRGKILEPLHRSRWFSRQPAALQGALVDRGRIAKLAKGQWLHSEGDHPSGLWAVLSGSMRLEITFGPHRSVLLTLVGPGNVLGQSAVFGGGAQLSTARAGEETFLLLVSDATLQAISGDHPILWPSMNDLLYRQLERRNQMLAEALCLPPRARVISRLLAIAEQRPPDSDLVIISQTDLGEMTGLTRKSANLHLLALQEAGLIKLKYRGVQLVKRRQLELLVSAHKQDRLG